MEIAFTIIVLIFSVVVHEVSHGFVAEHLGDPTARLAGRLTLNPLKHLDLFGSVILPLLLYYTSHGAFMFGYAKPVPYNPMNLKRPERGGALIAAAGPTANLFIALVFGLAFRAVVNFIPSAMPLANLLEWVVVVNLMLAVFNLVPIPPLDGSKVLFAFLPVSAHQFRITLERYGLFLLLLFIFFAPNLIVPVIQWLARLFLGG